MKKLFIYSAVATAMLTVTSCGDSFLSLEPPSSVTTDGYYVTEATIMQSETAAYAPMGWFDYDNGQYAALCMVSDIQGDDIYPGGGGESDNDYLHYISEYAANSQHTLDQVWGGMYSGVNRSIHLIDNANDPAAQITDDQRALFNAEGHALRDYYYSLLWKTWGNVPYYEENLGPDSSFLASQWKADDVYERVVSDLETTIDSNILPMKQTIDQAGRWTKAAMEMVYADMVMYQNDQTRYAKALGYMKEIINSGQYSLIPGDNYNDLFEQPTEWSNEIIMDVNYIAVGGTRDWGNYLGTGGTVLPELIGIDGLNYYHLESGHVADFDGTGWGFCPVAKEAYDAFETTDKRRDVAILNISQYMQDKAAIGDVVFYGGRYQNTGFFLRKYLPRVDGAKGSSGPAALNFGNNLHIYRYAETLLNAAELSLNAGDAGFAQTCLDQIRTRAGLASVPVTLDNIIQERRVEFIGEGKRYYDLVRTGKAASVLVPGGGVLLDPSAVEPATGQPWDGKHIATTPLLYTAPGTANPLRTQSWTENKKYLPIPQGEIDKTTGTAHPLVQNPY